MRVYPINKLLVCSQSERISVIIIVAASFMAKKTLLLSKVSDKLDHLRFIVVHLTTSMTVV